MQERTLFGQAADLIHGRALGDLRARVEELEREIAALREAGDALARVAGPCVDFIQGFEESENAQALALLLALQIVGWQALEIAPQPADGRGG